MNRRFRRAFRMPKSSLMGLRWVFAPAAAIVAAAACCAPAGAIVGGNRAVDGDPSTGPLDYQAALIRNDRPTTASGQFCGGSVRFDTASPFRHIVTAAHCVFDNSATAPGQPIAPTNLDVLVGTTSLTTGGTRLHVADISIDPDYDPATLAHDAAVVTLAGTTPLNGTGAQPIPFVDPNPWTPPNGPDGAVVSGWGRIDASTFPTQLRWAAMPFASDSSCQSSWASEGADTSIMVCAGAPGIDSCFGDSGGPLAVSYDDPVNHVTYPVLAGIVSYGDLACDGSPPGVYTRVASTAIHRYLSQGSPTSAPRNTSAPAVGGTIAVGQTITCGAGSWSGTGVSLDYQFLRGIDGRTTAALTNLGAQQSYVVTSDDVGSQLACFVKAHNGGGMAYTQSAWSSAVPAAPVIVPPTNQSPSQAPQDTAAPVARITKTACTATRCTLTVTVTDIGFSAGIQTVQSSVRSTYRSRCKRKGSHKTFACTKHRTSKPSVAALTSTRYKVVASKLPYGTQRFTVVAIDKAGHRQALPTTKTVTTKKPTKRR
ncbi:MAG TPA: serine protease [Solirubrobacteraceae bacterium]